jgi:hypothetical protein
MVKGGTIDSDALHPDGQDMPRKSKRSECSAPFGLVARAAAGSRGLEFRLLFFLPAEILAPLASDEGWRRATSPRVRASDEFRAMAVAAH